MRCLLLLGVLSCHCIAYAKVTPTQIDSSQIPYVSKTLSGVFASRTASDPNALGEDFEFELSAFYQDLRTSGIVDLDPTTSDHFLDSILTLKKGLYWNIDFSISTALPIPSNLISGFSFNLEHTKKIKFLILKSDLYISHYNLNDIINTESVGLTLVLYKKFKLAHVGLGANLESVSSVYNQNFLGSQLATSESNELEFIETALISKISTRLGAFRFTTSYLFRDKKSSLLNFAVGKRF